MTGFGAAAWQTSPRDKFIGWDHEQRKRNLHLIVNNARFLILPWVQSKNLASKILALNARQLPYDWEEKYNIRPVLMESFVEKNRFAGTCYKAANWCNVGQTKGRGKLGPPGKISVPIKDDGLVKSRKTDFLPQHIGIMQGCNAICCGQNKMLGLFTRPSKMFGYIL